MSEPASLVNVFHEFIIKTENSATQKITLMIIHLRESDFFSIPSNNVAILLLLKS